MAIPGTSPFLPPAAPPPAAPPAVPATPGVPAAQPPALSQLQQMLGGAQPGQFGNQFLLDAVRSRRKAQYGEIPGWSTPYQPPQQAAAAAAGPSVFPPAAAAAVGQPAPAPLSVFLGGSGAAAPVAGANVPAQQQTGWLGFLRSLLGQG